MLTFKLCAVVFVGLYAVELMARYMGDVSVILASCM